MGLRFRRSFKLFPGSRLNVSTRGVSLSLGAPGSTLNVSSRGVRATVGIPGTGLSYGTEVGLGQGGGTGGTAGGDQVDVVPVVWAPGGWGGAVQRFQSGPTAQLTSSSLADLREMMCSASVQRKNAAAYLVEVTGRIANLTRERRCKGFFLWSWAFEQRLSQIDDLVDNADSEADELQQWIDQSGAPVAFQFDDATRSASKILEQGLSTMLECHAVWDVTTRRGVDKRERSAASTAVERTRVNGHRRHARWVNAEEPGVLLENANGDSLYFYS